MPNVLDENEIQRLKNLPISEKLDQGDWYQYGKELELQNIVKSSSQKLQKINQTAQEDFEQAKQMLQDFLPHVDSSAEIYFPVTSIEYPERFTLGAESFINSGLQVISAGQIKIGKHCFIGPNCQFFTPNHHVTDKYLRREGWQYDAPITIGDDCWLGGSVILLPGVTIGDDVVIGAGSVVTKDIPSHSLAVGNPARVIKKFQNIKQ